MGFISDYELIIAIPYDGSQKGLDDLVAKLNKCECIPEWEEVDS